jgi:hypothetical protein
MRIISNSTIHPVKGRGPRGFTPFNGVTFHLVTKWNQLDAELRRTDKGRVGEAIHPEERISDSPLVGLRNPPHAPWKRTIVQWIVRYKKTMRTYLIGMLSGVMLAATFTFVFAIPANSDYWRMEIYKRGGGAWTLDMKTGHTGWRWMVDPILDTPTPTKRAVPPPRHVKVSERL